MQSPLPSSLTENLSLAIAILMLGVMAGFFWTYSFNVNYALLQMDGEAYARVQSLLNQNVRHPMFFLFFFGSAVVTAVAAVANLRHWRSSIFWLVLAAFLLYGGGVIVFTKFVNLPLNYYTESWLPGSLPHDWNEIRGRWNNANLLRVATSASAFGLCVIALMIRASHKH